ncbi:hypothetical protein BD410DRAFT_787659 [Rickenella mellea]|uniref:Uncharacterized protein n=1 Tax=Rickenella mellea TaxID=50990 RepID=A0A4Y7Q8X8_9AGAM|nr:hypothetical protein BD410DRAFT_787659 [Rickenella mellea]
MENIRKRIPFKVPPELLGTEEEETNARIQDEQEQEEVINALRVETDTLNAVIQRILLSSVGISLFLHTFLLLNPNVFLDTLSTPTPLIRLAALIQTSLQFNLLMLVRGWTWLPVRIREIPNFPISIQYTTLLASAVPTISILSGRSWSQTAVWAAADLVSLFVWTGLQWIREGNASIVELEKLRYEAKGA